MSEPHTTDADMMMTIKIFSEAEIRMSSVRSSSVMCGKKSKSSGDMATVLIPEPMLYFAC
jgi:hypothetical protein